MDAQVDRRGALAFLEEQLAIVGAQIREMQEYEAALRKSVELLSRPRQAMLYGEGPRTEYDGVWRSMHAQSACLAFLRDNPGQAFKASVIAHRLRERGVKGSDTRNFGSVVAGSVRRLVQQGRVEQVADESGIASFRAKKGKPAESSQPALPT